MNKIKEILSKIGKVINAVIYFIEKHWKLILGILASIGLFSIISKLFSFGPDVPTIPQIDVNAEKKKVEAEEAARIAKIKADAAKDSADINNLTTDQLNAKLDPAVASKIESMKAKVLSDAMKDIGR
jgi:ABC-type bacteriocin/lantibiotic exporter with double-glycine peptidase domain